MHLSPGLRGTGNLDGLLLPLGYATLATALGRIEQQLFDADPPTDTAPPDPHPAPDLQRRIAWLEDWRAELRATIAAEQAGTQPDGDATGTDG